MRKQLEAEADNDAFLADFNRQEQDVGDQMVNANHDDDFVNRQVFKFQQEVERN